MTSVDEIIEPHVPRAAREKLLARRADGEVRLEHAAMSQRSRSMRRSREVGGKVSAVQVLRATVRNGRIVVDAPTELPEGAQVELKVVYDDGLSDADRKELHESIARGIRDGRGGRVVDFDAGMDELDAEP